MTRRSSADVGLFVINGYSVLGQQTDINVEFEALVEETTVLGSTDQTWAPVGVARAAIEQNGFFDDGDQHTALNAIGGTAKVLCLGEAGNVAGRAFIGFSGALQTKYGIVPARSTLTKAKASYVGTGRQERDGLIIEPLATDTSGATITGTSRDHSASSAAGGAAFLHVTGLTLGGYTDVTAKIQHSADNAAWADLVTFANLAAIGAERKAIVGTINRYVRAVVTFNGAGAAQSITYFVGIVRY